MLQVHSQLHNLLTLFTKNSVRVGVKGHTQFMKFVSPAPCNFHNLQFAINPPKSVNLTKVSLVLAFYFLTMK